MNYKWSSQARNSTNMSPIATILLHSHLIGLEVSKWCISLHCICLLIAQIRNSWAMWSNFSHSPVGGVKNSHRSQPLIGWATLTPSSTSQKLVASASAAAYPTDRLWGMDPSGWIPLCRWKDTATPGWNTRLNPGSVVLRRSMSRLPPLFLFFFVNDHPAICDNVMPRHIHIRIYFWTFVRSPTLLTQDHVWAPVCLLRYTEFSWRWHISYYHHHPGADCVQVFSILPNISH